MAVQQGAVTMAETRYEVALIESSGSGKATAFSRGGSLSRRRRVAFTLIELLVVIAIISLLVSILLPSLKKAKSLALSSVCGSQLHTLSVSTAIYTNENNDLLPTYFDFTKLGDGVEPGTYAGSPYSSFMVTHFKSTPVEYTWIYGQALLYATEIVSDPRNFYCPSQRPRAGGNAGAWEKEPGEDRDWQWDKIADWEQAGWSNGGYMYNANGLKAPGGTYVQCKRVEDFTSETILAMDMLSKTESIPHIGLDGKWNVLWTNGSVSTHGNQTVVDMIADPNWKQNEWWGHQYQVREEMGLPGQPESDSAPI
jgi:prepilin-type N-terminal cleavage/methylation domain-containing protein